MEAAAADPQEPNRARKGEWEIPILLTVEI
jgi:hypothetical protein